MAMSALILSRLEIVVSPAAHRFLPPPAPDVCSSVIMSPMSCHVDDDGIIITSHTRCAAQLLPRRGKSETLGFGSRRTTSTQNDNVFLLHHTGHCLFQVQQHGIELVGTARFSPSRCFRDRRISIAPPERGCRLMVLLCADKIPWRQKKSLIKNCFASATAQTLQRLEEEEET